MHPYLCGYYSFNKWHLADEIAVSVWSSVGLAQLAINGFDINV